MKDNTLEMRLVKARPMDYKVNTLFTDKVMEAIQSHSALSLHVRTKDSNKKETLFVRIRHLPKIAVIALAIMSLFALATVTYAAVETISHVLVSSTKQNEYGREQFTVTSKDCKGQSNRTFELQKGVNMSVQDGANVLQARCDLALVNDWLATKVGDAMLLPSIYSSRPDTVTSIDAASVILQKSGRRSLSSFTNILNVANPASARDLKVGQTVFSYPDGPITMNGQDVRSGVSALFIVTQPAKYYTGDMQSYVDERTACRNNPERQCLNQDSEATHTYLIVARNDRPRAAGSVADYKEVQGKVVAYDNTQLVLDAGGARYTIATPSNIITTYNKMGVYKLAELDNIYSYTDPNDLKIEKGDSLSITYLEDLSKSSPAIPWTNVLTVNLLVQHSPQDKNILVKY